jgi:hypothetical protein
MSMGKAMIDVKSLAIGFLLGVCALLAAAQVQKTPDPVQEYRIATATATWIINTGTGDVWQLNGEYGSGKFTWVYAGRPTARSQPSQGTDY